MLLHSNTVEQTSNRFTNWLHANMQLGINSKGILKYVLMIRFICFSPTSISKQTIVCEAKLFKRMKKLFPSKKTWHID